VTTKTTKQAKTKRATLLDAGIIRSTIDMPEDLWRAAKIRALDERTDYRQIVLAALREYLKTPISRDAK
jgi:hypothetical protein